jgi:hypothetical protein
VGQTEADKNVETAVKQWFKHDTDFYRQLINSYYSAVSVSVFMGTVQKNGFLVPQWLCIDDSIDHLKVRFF